MALRFVAIIVFVFAALGTQTVFHDYAVTADEYLADFQAKIFLHGKIQAEVPSAWVSAVRFLNLPFFVRYFPANHRGIRFICRSTPRCGRSFKVSVFKVFLTRFSLP